MRTATTNPRPPKRGAKPPAKHHPLKALKGKPTHTALDVSDSDDSLVDSDDGPMDDDPLMDSDSDLPPLENDDDDDSQPPSENDSEEPNGMDLKEEGDNDMAAGLRDALADALDSDDDQPQLASKAERKAALLDRRAARKQAAAAAEAADMQANLGGAAPQESDEEPHDAAAFSVFEDAAEGSSGAIDLALVQRRLKEVVRVLDHFQALREPGRSRAEYINLVGQLYVFECV